MKERQKDYTKKLGLFIIAILGTIYLFYTYTSTKTTGPTDYYKSKSSQFNAGVFADGKAQFNIGFRFLLNNKG